MPAHADGVATALTLKLIVVGLVAEQVTVWGVTVMATGVESLHTGVGMVVGVGVTVGVGVRVGVGVGDVPKNVSQPLVFKLLSVSK